jgi:hypothetical protein
MRIRVMAPVTLFDGVRYRTVRSANKMRGNRAVGEFLADRGVRGGTVFVRQITASANDYRKR